MSNIKNYNTYRTQLKTLKGPILPYLGVYLRDLLFVKEGNKMTNEEGKPLIDFVRFSSNIIMDIYKFQTIEYKVRRTSFYFLS